MTECGTITSLLGQVRTGDKEASDRLFEHVYADLKRMGSVLLAAKTYRAGALGSTALVNAACERLLGRDNLVAEDRRHFFFLLSRAMQDVLVEQARADLAAKRGGGFRRVPLDDFGVDTGSRDTSILDVREALEELRQHDPDAAEIVMLRFFAGRSLHEIGELMDRTLAIVRRDWEYARAWLHERLSDPDRTRRNS